MRKWVEAGLGVERVCGGGGRLMENLGFSIELSLFLKCTVWVF